MEIWSTRCNHSLPVSKIIRVTKPIEFICATIPVGATGYICLNPHDSVVRKALKIPDHFVFVVWHDSKYPEVYLDVNGYVEIIQDFTAQYETKQHDPNFCNCLVPDTRLSYAGIGPGAVPFYVCKLCKKEIEHI